MFFAALLFALLPTLAAQPGRFGVPACSAPDQELAVRSAFLLCYDSALKTPIWTAYELTPQRLNGTALRPKRFRHDAQLSVPSAYDADYRNSGFSRGHMAPAADFAWSESAMQDTFLLSNVIPQNSRVNAGKWKQVENAVRKLAASADVYIFTGPIFDCGHVARIGRGQVAVPCEMFKVVMTVRGGRKTMYAAIVPNEYASGSVDEYSASVEEVECRTGLDFFRALDEVERHQLESALNKFTPAR